MSLVQAAAFETGVLFLPRSSGSDRATNTPCWCKWENRSLLCDFCILSFGKKNYSFSSVRFFSVSFSKDCQVDDLHSPT